MKAVQTPEAMALLSVAAKPHEIQLIYLFGSRARGPAGPGSDYDFALLFSSQPSPEAVYAVHHRLAEIVQDAPVDLVVLNKAPIELRYNVIASGILLYEASTFLRVEFEATTLSLYFDSLPILRRERDDLLMGKDDEPGIQRYRKALGKTEKLLAEIRST